MYEKSFRLEIITPGRVVFQGEVTSVSAPGVMGGFQVLYDHAPMLSAIGVGVLKVKDKEGKDMVYTTSGGFAEVKNNSVVILAESAERHDEIDVKRAKAAKERASRRLEIGSNDPQIDAERARVALARAINRLKYAQK